MKKPSSIFQAKTRLAHALCLASFLLCCSARAEQKPVSGAFIQFNRNAASYSVEHWRDMLQSTRETGINTLIIQWTAEHPLLYFKDKKMDFKEQHDVLERLLQAAQGMRFSIYLGLQHDPAFWNEITARDKALRDYFLVRQAQNERLQKALLKKFDQRKDWVGYYIVDEIDDLSWREPERRQLLKAYIDATTAFLHDKDPQRKVACSAFFRARSAPRVMAQNLAEITAESGLDYLLMQDGAGAGDPPADVLFLYYRALLNTFQDQPELWAVLEAFREISKPNQPFQAVPTSGNSLKRQISAASGFKRLVLFSFPDYVDPMLGPEAQTLYQILKESNDHAIKEQAEK